MTIAFFCSGVYSAGVTPENPTFSPIPPRAQLVSQPGRGIFWLAKVRAPSPKVRPGTEETFVHEIGGHRPGQNAMPGCGLYPQPSKSGQAVSPSSERNVKNPALSTLTTGDWGRAHKRTAFLGF